METTKVSALSMTPSRLETAISHANVEELPLEGNGVVRLADGTSRIAVVSCQANVVCVRVSKLEIKFPVAINFIRHYLIFHM
jgi:hypothetical protein